MAPTPWDQSNEEKETQEMRKLLSVSTSVLLGLALTVGGATTAFAAPPSGPPGPPADIVCPPLDSGKIDTTGDPATVEVTAPEGKLIDHYCVKAGPGYELIDVNPALKTVIVDHPTKDSVSHYSLRYIDAPAEPDPKPDRPEDVVKYKVIKETVDCDTKMVTIKKAKTTIGWYYSEKYNKWVPTKPVVEIVYEEREAKKHELKDCPVEMPDRPEDVVKYKVIKETVDCDTKTVTIKKAKTTIGWYYSEKYNKWVPTKPVVEIVYEEREAKKHELKDCPVEMPDRPEDVVKYKVIKETVDCDTKMVTIKKAKTTIGWYYSEKYNKWVPTKPVVEIVYEEREAKKHELKDCPVEMPDRPEDVVKYKVIKETVDCDTKMVTIKKAKTTIGWYYSEKYNKWVPTKPVVEIVYEEREAKKHELKDCPLPEKPDVIVTYKVVKEKLDCESKTVKVTKEKTTIDWVFKHHKWVKMEPVVETVYETRAATKHELKDCVQLPTLPVTGGEGALDGGMLAGGLLLLGAAGLFMQRRIRPLAEAAVE